MLRRIFIKLAAALPLFPSRRFNAATDVRLKEVTAIVSKCLAVEDESLSPTLAVRDFDHDEIQRDIDLISIIFDLECRYKISIPRSTFSNWQAVTIQDLANVVETLAGNKELGLAAPQIPRDRSIDG